MSFDVKDLEAIKSINEFGSINSAAEKIYLSKSALSERIKKLEARLGFEILVREGYKVKLTRQAKFLLAHSEQVLNAHNELINKAKLIKDNVEAFFKIGVSIIFPTALSMRLFKALSQEFPDTEFNFFREVLSGEEMLKKKIIDISISETIKDNANLDFKKISSSDMVLLLSSEHSFLKLPKKDQNLENLKHFPQVVIKSTLKENSNIGCVYDDAPRITVCDDLTKRGLILNGTAWARLPKSEVNEYLSSGKLTSLENIEETKTVDIYLAKRKSHSESKIVEFILKFFETLETHIN